MESILTRLVIYPKDVTRIVGCSERKARRILATIRMKYNKDGHAFITVEEFCMYTGIPEGQVRHFLM